MVLKSPVRSCDAEPYLDRELDRVHAEHPSLPISTAIRQMDEAPVARVRPSVGAPMYGTAGFTNQASHFRILIQQRSIIPLGQSNSRVLQYCKLA